MHQKDTMAFTERDSTVDGAALEAGLKTIMEVRKHETVGEDVEIEDVIDVLVMSNYIIFSEISEKYVLVTHLFISYFRFAG